MVLPSGQKNKKTGIANAACSAPTRTYQAPRYAIDTCVSRQATTGSVPYSNHNDPSIILSPRPSYRLPTPQLFHHFVPINRRTLLAGGHTILIRTQEGPKNHALPYVHTPCLVIITTIAVFPRNSPFWKGSDNKACHSHGIVFLSTS